MKTLYHAPIKQPVKGIEFETEFQLADTISALKWVLKINDSLGCPVRVCGHGIVLNRLVKALEGDQ